MDFLNQLTAQLRDLFGSMTPGARVTAGLLLAVVVVSLGFLFQQTTAGPDEYLFGAEPQPSSKIARMEAAMASSGVTGYEVEGNRIKVPRGQREKAIAAIAAADELPADVYRHMDDAFDKGSVFDSGEVKRQRIRAAREKMLAGIIGAMPFVDQAYVICDEREAAGLSRGTRVSVSVSVLPAPGEAITSKRARVLKSFAAKSCGVTPESVSVTNLGGDSLAGADGVDPADFGHELYAFKALAERDLQQKIYGLLDFIPGVRVSVKAVVDETKEHKTIEVKPDQAAVAIETKETEERTTQSRAAGGGRPGTVAQGPTRNGVDETKSDRDTSETELTGNETRNVVGSKTEEKSFYGGTLKEAYATIGVPRSHVRNVFRERRGLGPDEELDTDEIRQFEESFRGEIQAMLEPQLPELRLGEDEFKQAIVGFFDDLPRDLPAPPSAVSNALAWTGQYGNTLAMSALALVALLMLRSIATSSPADAPSGAGALRLDGAAGGGSGGAADAPGGGDDGEEDERPKLKLKKADTLKDDLAEMVAGDPDAAAAILRGWIKNAS